MPIRIAYGRINHETNAFSPVDTSFEAFARAHLLEGEALAAACSRSGEEVAGYAKHAELSGFVRAVEERGGQVIGVPLVSAWAVPSGPLSEEAFETVTARMLDRLRRAGKVDGVYLALHGAMTTRHDPHPEARLLEAVRREIGPDVPLAVSFDLHAQLCAKKLAPVTFACAYRTNPHRDHAATGRRTGRILIDTALGRVRPVYRWRTLPMVLGGGTTVDLLPTMRPIFGRMKKMEREPGVLDASLCMVHLWNDDPEIGWSTHVITDGDAPLADRLADELADRAWAVREVMPPTFLSASEAIARARSARLARNLGAVCFSDASDVVAAGATGENTNLIRALLAEGQGLVSYAPILDAHAAAELATVAPGESIDCDVGGRIDPVTNPPLHVRGRLLRTLVHEPFGRMAVLDLDHLKLVVTEHTPIVMKPAFYRDVGLDPWKADVLVVKSFFHFRIYFALVNRRTFYVRTRGLTDVDRALALTFDGPVHPKDRVDDWRPADRRRRG